LRTKIVEFVTKGDFGLGSAPKPDGTYERVRYKEPAEGDDVVFEAGVFLLKKATAEALKSGSPPRGAGETPNPEPVAPLVPDEPFTPSVTPSAAETQTVRLTGPIPPELWNRFGTKILAKLRSAGEVQVSVDFSVTVRADAASSLKEDPRQILPDLGILQKIQID
jgi:hypothetical protein